MSTQGQPKQEPKPLTLEVKIQPGESTRFSVDEFELARRIAAWLDHLAAHHSKGAKPAVTVSIKKEGK